MAGLLVVVGVLVLATGFGLWRRHTDGIVRDATRAVASPDVVSESAEMLTENQLGEPLGSQATFVQFSSAFCQPCRATRLVLADVTSAMPGVSHIEIDAESNLDLVRQFDVRRTPTMLLLDGDGAVRKRATGLMRKSDVVAALAQVV